MQAFFKKYGKTLLLAIIITVVLALAFFLAESPTQSDISPEKQSLARSAQSAESRASLTFGNSSLPSASSAAPVSSYEASHENSVNVSVSKKDPETHSAEESSVISVSEESSEESSSYNSIIKSSADESLMDESSAQSAQEESKAISSGSESISLPSADESSPQSSSEENIVSLPTEECEQQLQSSEESASLYCTFAIECGVLLDKKDRLSRNKRGFLPDDGIILAELDTDADEGESVFDLTKRICREQGIPFEFTLTPLYNSAYIEGIANLYEFDCGSASGWVYTVNGEMPAVGCSNVKLQNGDKIVWHYSCALGKDISQ